MCICSSNGIIFLKITTYDTIVVDYFHSAINELLK